MQELLPLLLVERAAGEAGEGLAGERVGVRSRIAEQVPQHFRLRQAGEERCDERLNRDDRAVARAGITPRFEVVRSGQVPRRSLARLVLVRAEVDDGLGGLGNLAPSLGSGVSRVRPEDDHGFRTDRSSEAGSGLRSLVQFNRLAERAEHFVHRVRERMDGERLATTGNDEGRALMCDEVFGALRNPLGVHLRARREGSRVQRSRAAALLEHFRRELRRNRRDLARSHTHAVVGAEAGQRHQRLDRVEAADEFKTLRGIGLGNLAALREVARVAIHLVLAAEEIAVEREDALGRRELEVRRDLLARHEARGLGVDGGIHRVVIGPNRVRKLR